MLLRAGGGGGRIGKIKQNNIGKYIWEKLDVNPLMVLVGVNDRHPILHMSKIMVHCYSTDEITNQFSIGYIINPSLNCNKVFRLQVEKFISVLLSSKTM